MKEAGYIYIYKCIVGLKNNVCKIGKTKNIKNDRSRLRQHLRTPYHGFVPYTRFDNNEVIATVFRVNDIYNADKDVKKYFGKNYKEKIQLSDLEIYNIDYATGFTELYYFLKEKKYFVGIYRDGYSSYKDLKLSKKIILDEYKDYEGTTKKEDFDYIAKKLKRRYKGKYPEDLLVMLRKKEEFKESSPSHFNDCIDFGYGLVLDVHVSRAEKIVKLETLKEFLKNND